MRFDPTKIRADLFWSRVEKSDGCWLWTAFLDGKGYGRFAIPKGRKGGSWSEGAHRVSWVLSNGPITGRLHVLHNCNNPRCVNPAHLRLGTHAENMHDLKLSGRAAKPRGEASPISKLTWSQVRAIRAEMEPNLHALGRRYGVTPQNISCILKGKTWREHGVVLGDAG